MEQQRKPRPIRLKRLASTRRPAIRPLRRNSSRIRSKPPKAAMRSKPPTLSKLLIPSKRHIRNKPRLPCLRKLTCPPELT